MWLKWVISWTFSINSFWLGQHVRSWLCFLHQVKVCNLFCVVCQRELISICWICPFHTFPDDRSRAIFLNVCLQPKQGNRNCPKYTSAYHGHSLFLYAWIHTYIQLYNIGLVSYEILDYILVSLHMEKVENRCCRSVTPWFKSMSNFQVLAEYLIKKVKWI